MVVNSVEALVQQKIDAIQKIVNKEFQSLVNYNIYQETKIYQVSSSVYRL